MAMKSTILVFSVFSIWVLSNVDSAPAPAVDCSSLVLNMADCLTFVTAGSTVSKPEGTCCSGLKTVVKTNVGCLCETFKNSAQFGVDLNVTKAMSLPNACHVSAPSVSNCGLSLVTGAAPANSPLGALSPSATAGAPTSVAGANDLAPAPTPTPGSTSGSAARSVSVGSLLVAIVAASVL